MEPYQLVATGRRWYLLAFDLDRDDWRTFRLDRMADVRATTFRFRPREAPDAAAYVQRVGDREPLPARGAGAGARAGRGGPRADHAGGRARVEAVDDGTCRVVAGGNSLEALAWHFGSLGHAFTIEAPAELREAAGGLRRPGDGRGGLGGDT